MQYYNVRTQSASLACMKQSIKKIELESNLFICPRCTDSDERRDRLGQSFTEGLTQDQREIETVVQPSQFEDERSYGQQSPFSTEQNDITVSDSLWPVGIESWHIHEIKPQRECFTRKTLSVKLMITQFTDCEPQPKHPEDYCELETHILSGELVHPIGYFDDEQPQSTVVPESNLLKSDELIPHDSDKSPQSVVCIDMFCDQYSLVSSSLTSFQFNTCTSYYHNAFQQPWYISLVTLVPMIIATVFMWRNMTRTIYDIP
ncbi:unnamed protein product, partial [Rotaria socialis]